jgi:hypothetical protein
LGVDDGDGVLLHHILGQVAEYGDGRQQQRQPDGQVQAEFAARRQSCFNETGQFAKNLVLQAGPPLIWRKKDEIANLLFIYTVPVYSYSSYAILNSSLNTNPQKELS